MTAAETHYMPRCQVLCGCLAACSVAAIALEVDVLGVDVDVHDGAEPGTRCFGLQLRFVSCHSDCLAAGFGPQSGFAGDVEVDSLDLVCPGCDHVDQQLNALPHVGAPS
jgi:hypothetical protein